jgi:hypothetical protein
MAGVGLMLPVIGSTALLAIRPVPLLCTAFDARLRTSGGQQGLNLLARRMGLS